MSLITFNHFASDKLLSRKNKHVFLRVFLTSPPTARRSNQSILKEINPEYSLEGLKLKLKLQYFGYLMRRTYSLEKALMPKDCGQEKRATEDEMVGWPH